LYVVAVIEEKVKGVLDSSEERGAGWRQSRHELGRLRRNKNVALLLLLLMLILLLLLMLMLHGRKFDVLEWTLTEVALDRTQKLSIDCKKICLRSLTTRQ
jgi:hypothetical protein